MPTPPRTAQTPCRACPLKKREVFRAVTPEELAFIEEFKTGEFIADPGATILAEGSKTPHLFTVLSGWGFRYKGLPDGRRQILNFVLPGDFLGLQGAALNEMQHSVEALTTMVLCVFAREKLWSLYSGYPSLGYDITWLASRSERLLDDNLLSVGRRSAVERVAYVVVDLFSRGRQLGLVTGQKMRVPFTQQHMADALGMSLVHTNKTLRKLTQSKIIKWQSGYIEMVDEKKLMALAAHDATAAQLRPLI